MARRQVTLFGWVIEWHRPKRGMVYIRQEIAIELIRDSYRAAIAVAQNGVERSIVEFARKLKRADGRYVIP